MYRLKIILPSFLARADRDEPPSCVVELCLFGQVHLLLVQWDLSPLIAPAKTSVEGRAIPLCC